jgi:hypothetical protein
METAMPPQTIESRLEKLDALSVQISQLREDLDAKISATEKALSEKILAGDERILTHVRVLHEDVISRLALIQESQRPVRRRRR